MSAVINPAPPTEVYAAIREGIERLCDSRDPMYHTLLGALESRRLLTQPVYTVDPESLVDMTRALSDHTPSMYRGWRFIAGTGKAIAAGYVAETDGWRLTSVSYGPQLEDSMNVRDVIGLVADLPDRACELRVLEIPVLNQQVLWFVPDTKGAEEWIVPLNGLHGAKLTPYQRISCTDFREICGSHLQELVQIEDPDPMPNGPLDDGEVKPIHDLGG